MPKIWLCDTAKSAWICPVFKSHMSLIWQKKRHMYYLNWICSIPCMVPIPRQVQHVEKDASFAWFLYPLVSLQKACPRLHFWSIIQLHLAKTARRSQITLHPWWSHPIFPIFEGSHRRMPNNPQAPNTSSLGNTQDFIVVLPHHPWVHKPKG